MPAPSGLAYPQPPAWVIAQPIAPLTPTFVGTATSFAVAPALPSGLSLNAATGVVSGTPSVVVTGDYTVTASNSAGSVSAVIAITVNDVPPSISYQTANVVLAKGALAPSIAPTVTGGAPVSWSISGALPAGLQFSTTDGRITGTPTEVASATQYQVTATNSGGQSQTTLTLSVDSGVLVELGHANAVHHIRLSATRALTHDQAGHWVLWDLSTRDRVVQGENACGSSPDPCPVLALQPIAVAGDTAVIQKPAGLELRAAADGQVLATVGGAPISSWRLATDGTYVSAAGATGLSVWTRSGTLLFARSGDYSRAVMYALPDAVRVARGAAGDSVIETLSVPSGASSISTAFQGDFKSWFTDGERFLTNLATTVWVYSKAVAQEDLSIIGAAQQLGGHGLWFWARRQTGVVDVYAVGASTAPAATYAALGAFTDVVASATQIAIIASPEDRLRIVDLSAASLSSSTLPGRPLPSLRTYAAGPSGSWLISDQSGVILDGPSLASTRQYFGYGAASSIAGSADRAVVATASGTILYFNVHTKELEGSLQLSESQVDLSTDGTVLVTAGLTDDRTVSAYSLPDGALLQQWPFSSSSTLFPMAVTTSASANTLGFVLRGASGARERRVIARVSGAVLWSDTHEEGPLQLSPDGTLLAAGMGVRSATAATNIFHNGVLSTAVPGWPVGWLSDSRLLVKKYVLPPNLMVEYDSSALYDASGSKVRDLGIPVELSRIQPVTADSCYSGEFNEILSTVDGSITWTGSSNNVPGLVGAIAGPFAIFSAGAYVRAEPY